MKSFFNSLYTITKPQKKLKATPNAVDLAMDLLPVLPLWCYGKVLDFMVKKQ